MLIHTCCDPVHVKTSSVVKRYITVCQCVYGSSYTCITNNAGRCCPHTVFAVWTIGGIIKNTYCKTHSVEKSDIFNDKFIVYYEFSCNISEGWLIRSVKMAHTSHSATLAIWSFVSFSTSLYIGCQNRVTKANCDLHDHTITLLARAGHRNAKHANNNAVHCKPLADSLSNLHRAVPWPAVAR